MENEPYDDFGQGLELGWDDRPEVKPKPKLKLVPPLPDNLVFLEDYRDGTPPKAA